MLFVPNCYCNEILTKILTNINREHICIFVSLIEIETGFIFCILQDVIRPIKSNKISSPLSTYSV